MSTINQVKEAAEADSPLLLFECMLPGGTYQRFSTQSITFNGEPYEARVLNHDLFDFQLSADDAMESVAKVSLLLANADSILSEIDANVGWKGTQLTVYLVFADLASGTVTTESAVVFRGVAGNPDEVSEDSMKLTFANRLSLVRVGLPETRIQRLCPWAFPATAAQRTLAAAGDRYARFHRCGYSPDVNGGIGTAGPNGPYTSCDHSRSSCEQRGMFNIDGAGKNTARFGGLEWVPSAITVRGYGDKTSSTSRLVENAAKYNDFIPMLYGTGWLQAPVTFARNHGNLTHMEVLLGMGPIDQVMKVVVNDVEIPKAVNGMDMTTTGWYFIVSTGEASGSFNPDFKDAHGNPLGDPHGSIASLAIVVPNRISTGSSVPSVQVLMQGMHVDRYNPDGTPLDTAFSSNPAWITLDILRRSGWSVAELDIPSFAGTAAYCDALIATTDLNGNTIHVPRYRSNLVITKRRTAAEIVRGVRVACGMMLRYGASGLLQLLPEAAVAVQHPALPDGSNASATLANGWPAYEFGDGTAATTGIARDGHGRSTVRIFSRGMAELSNRLNVEFQDEANEYQQDSLSLVNDDDQSLIGYELSSVSTALGLPNFNQATRVLSRQLAKLNEGNRFIQFETSFRALKLRPGDIITVTYAKEGLTRIPFRIVKLTPALNFRRVQVIAQIHDDNWYSDVPSVIGGSGRQPGSAVALPRPLLGTTLNAGGTTDFAIAEQTSSRTDGSAATTLRVSFTEPVKPAISGPNPPLLSLSPQVVAGSGTLPGGSNFYYAVTANDQSGNEGMLSFTVYAATAASSPANSVMLTGLSFPKTAASFNVYRGTNPQLLYRIAQGQALGGVFTDSGLAAQPVGPPDANLDHANFYYRLEFAGPLLTTASSTSTISNADMNATPTAYTGMTVRLISGTGMGQERKITANSATMLTVSPNWTTLPDVTTQFVITESAWRFGAVSKTSPVEFEVPNRTGTVVEVSGRGASVRDQEGTPELCPVTRWVVGGGAGNQLDTDVPPTPTFVLAAPGGGNLSVSQVGFATLTNTRSITAGTLQVAYFDELQMPATQLLAGAADAVATQVVLNAALATPLPQALQIDAEILKLISYNAATNTATVLRAQFGSSAAPHAANAAVLPVRLAAFVVPFARDFFENPASQNFAHSIHMPDARVLGAQLWVTNSQGDSAPATQCYTSGPNTALRTCSGGQLALQVGGYLAVQQSAAPPLMVEASHAARDVRASVTEAPGATPIILNLWQGTTAYCTLTIPPGQTTSNIIDGQTLETLHGGSALRLDIAQVGQAWQSSPGKDLTVTIRF